MEFEIVSRDGFTWTVDAQVAQLFGDNLTLLTPAKREDVVRGELVPVAIFPAGGWFSCVASDSERFTTEQVEERIGAALEELRDKLEDWRTVDDLTEVQDAYDRVIQAIDDATGREE
jgi:hypothetical protein